MFGRRKVTVQKMEDDRLLDNIHQIQQRIGNTQRMINNSVDVDDTTRIHLKLDQLKYQFLYLEARRRKAKAKATTNIIFGDEDTFLKQPSRAEKHW